MNFTICIPTKRDAWKWLALFAYRKWAGTGSSIMPTGVPGNRDPEHPCTGYEPVPRGHNTWGDCNTDGHYLCEGCCHKKEPINEEEAELQFEAERAAR